MPPAPPRLTALLTTHSFFSEGAGTASPARLAELAAQRGFSSVALTDDASVAGAVELSGAAATHGLRAVVGATAPLLLERAGARRGERLEVYPVVLLAVGRPGYAALCRLLTDLKAGERPGLPLDALRAEAAHLALLTGGRRGFPTVLGAERRVTELTALLRDLRGAFRERLFVQLYHDGLPGDRRRQGFLRALARDLGLPTVAAPEIRMATQAEYPLLDALTCARLGTDVSTPHPERPRTDLAHLATPEVWARRIPHADALANAERLAQRCTFTLQPDQLTAPEPTLPDGLSARAYLRRRAFAGLHVMYRGAARDAARARLRHELRTVHELKLEGFFLCAAEITDYCRDHGILAAGRGSAAGSVLCHALGITLADPIRHNLLFERFLHTGRRSMPDVDIDIASSRRDQVLAWVEDRWGAGGAGEAMVANRITYRLPSAVQDLGRALGLPPEQRDRLTRALGRDYRHHRPHRAADAAVVFDEVLGDAPVKGALLRLLSLMEPKFVRHLAPHSGGVVLSGDPLTHHSPLTRSSGGIRMLSFNKEDVEALGLIKLDLLGLRMLGVLERVREDVVRLEGRWLDFGDLPDDPAVWRRIQAGDTMALFQIESPAQVQMSARLRPEHMTDLAHQIALIRPGPIQSGTVHPYVRRRLGEEVTPTLREPLHGILRVSHGVLLFQEQILRLAVQYAGMTWEDADRFRRDVAGAEEDGTLDALRERFVQGAARTCAASAEEAREVFGWCASFRGYGFAESHAWSFAQHAYASAWLRHHHPAPYLAAVLTEHPGMWPAHTITQEARRWGVRLAPLDINHSAATYRAEDARTVRVPFTAVHGISTDAARAIVLERLVGGKYHGVEDAHERLPLTREQHEALVQAGAYGEDRRRAYYALTARANARPAGQGGLLTPASAPPELPALTPDDLLRLDLQLTGVSGLGRDLLDAHRARLRDLGCAPLGNLKAGQRAWTAGVIVARQRPPTARGFAFYVIQDGHHRAQVIISPDLWEAHRQLLRDANLLLVEGEVNGPSRALTIRALRLSELFLPAPRISGYAFG